MLMRHLNWFFTGSDEDGVLDSLGKSRAVCCSLPQRDGLSWALSMGIPMVSWRDAVRFLHEDSQLEIVIWDSGTCE